MSNIMRVVKLHDGQCLWPAHKSLKDVLMLRDTTPEFVWEVTYQGHPVQRQGTIFKRDWWEGATARFDASKTHPTVYRYISFDTASSKDEDAAYTAWTVGEIDYQYRVRIVEIGRERLDMPELVRKIHGLFQRWNFDNRLKGIIIENKSSGIGALQTLRESTLIPPGTLIGFDPKVDKPTRWGQVAVWCSLGCVLLPFPDESVPWLATAEEEIFNVPNADHLDQADSFAQLLLYLENYLREGYTSRSDKGA